MKTSPFLELVHIITSWKYILTGSDVAPGWQSVHEVAPESENVLAGHCEHNIASDELKVPAVHGEQWSPSMN
jgi:hypothetical protein